jgi:hypothetical protein
MKNGLWVRSRRGYLSIGASVVAMVAAVPAMAQCEPDPTVPNGLTQCSGLDADGLRVTTDGTRVQVDAGAIVTRAGDVAITVDMPIMQGPYVYYARSAALDVAGTVAGVSVLSGSAGNNYDPYGTSATITVAAGGVIGGGSGIVAGSSSDNPYGTAAVKVDNSGTILGLDGAALRSTAATRGGFDTVTNRAGATMGAIAAPVGSLTNAGTIDGGSASAIAQPSGYNSGLRQDPWNNSGTIRSNSTVATVLDFSTSQALTNSGTIANAGSGEALKSTAVVLINTGTGLVQSAGAVAINAGTYLDLVNTGRIEGSVISGGVQQPFGGGSRVDSSAGLITGDLTLGSSNDTVVARYVGSNLDTGVQGLVDAGDGIDTLQLQTTADTNIGTSVALPASFERFGIDIAADTTTTLGTAFVSPGTVTVSGNGTLVNQGTIEAAGQALLATDTSSYPQIINQGAIRTTSGTLDQYGVVLGNGTFSNEGEVRTAGAGITGGTSFANSGTISSVGTAVTLFSASFSNTGEIRSTDATAVSISGTAYGFGAVTQNSGLIDGAVAGIALSGTLVNTGTISSAQTGVILGWGGALDNRASGVVSGGTQAIGGGEFGGSNSVVLNAGTIRGNVDFTSAYTSFYPSNNRFFALPGGVLEGDLKLGYGDILITEAVNTGPGRFAGINGNVSANNSDLRYEVRSDVTLTHAQIAGFTTIGYELFDNAALKLTSAGGASQPVILAGTGSVDLTLDIASTSQPAIQRTSLLTDEGYGSDLGVQSIISRGALSLMRSDPYGYYNVVSLIAGDTFENAGTIEVRDPTAAPYTPAAGITGGTVINSGTINLSNAVGVRNAASFTNTGSILQIAGGGAATGVIDTPTIVNRGTISVDGVAIGRSQYFYYPPVTVTNAAEGVISSNSGTAVAISGGTFTNAGSVVGAVDLGFEFNYYSASTPVRNSNSGAYVAAGGTVTGDVLFGNGYDAFITKTGETGVSGIIDGGEGSDIFGYDLSSSRTVTLGDNPQFRNFESLMLYARGADTVLTLAGANRVIGGLYVGGQGTVINQASIAERVTSGVPYPLMPADYPIGLARFENQGTLESGISAQVGSFKNTGTIEQYQGLYPYADPGVDIYNDGKIDFVNEGKIGTAVGLGGNDDVSVVNSGTIVLGDVYRDAYLPTALDIEVYGETAPNISVSNSGTISADLTDAPRSHYNAGIYVSSQQPSTIALTNAVSGTISASGGRLAFGVIAFNGSLTLDNAGTIRGGNVDANAITGAAVLVSDGPAVIRNTGTLDGAVLLSNSADRVENSGTITGLVSLGGGDDTFIQRAGSKLGATVEGDEGIDSFIVDSTGGTSLVATQIAGFEGLLQIGTGTAIYAGSFDLNTIELQSGTLAVAAGQSLATSGTVTVTGGDAGATVQNAGTIAGAVRLGQGNDTYVEYAGSSAGSIDGGAGSDLYRIVLSGNRSGITDVTSFERLALDGSGTLDVTLNQSYDSVSLTGTNLTARLADFAIGRLDGSSADEQVVLDGDIAVADLQGGNDLLSLGAARLAGTYQGGAGVDTLRLTTSGPVRVDGRIAGFEAISLASNALTVAGTLGASGDRIALGDGAQVLTLAPGGTIGGNLDLGAGDDSLFVAAGAVLGGTVQGGAGNDLATFDVTGGRTLSGILGGFERLVTQGSGALTLSGGAFAFDRVDLASDLTVAANASLATAQVAFGPAGTRLAITGGFAGSITGGEGTDSIDISGGSASAPVALRNLSAVEQLRIGGGLTTISGTASVGSLSLTAGRLIGLASSTITAPTITVGTGATFGSAGIVNGNVAVAGTLSPGASPGTMTVNGNLALAGSSISVFEITPTASDKLLVNGQLTIAQGATLQIVATEAVHPGQSLDLIVASGGITGSYTNVIKPGSLLGFLVQQDGRLTLRGEFANSATFAPAVQSTITYVNDLLRSGQASSAFLAAVPALLTQSGATDTGAFARLAPEPYATATQIAVEHGLELAGAARGDAFAAPAETTGGFAFATALGSSRTLQTGDGAADARTRSYGVVGGLGLAGENGSVGAFIGYLDSKQRLKDLDARTEADGLVAGIHGRWSRDQIGIKATIAYDAGKAKTTRMIPGGQAQGRYDLRGWMADLVVDYAVPLSGNWTVRPSLGATAIRVTRDGTVETGASAFVLNVARNRDWAAFADGALTFEGGQRGVSAVRPYLTLGVRYQFEGRTPYAVAALDGGTFALGARGVSRAPVVASATLGWDIAVSSRVSVFAAATGETGDADHRFSSRGGLKIAF